MRAVHRVLMRHEPLPHPRAPIPVHNANIVRQSANTGMKRRRRSGPMTASDLIEDAAESQFLLRFVVPARELEALEAAVRAEPAHAQRRLSTGFDTADGRLAARGVFLSLCKRGREWVQVAVATSPDCARLLVHEVDLGVRRRDVVPALLPHLHDGSEAGAALRAALGDAMGAEDGESALRASFAIDAARLAREVTLAGAVVEMAQVTGMITTDDASMSFLEFELRLVSGPLDALFAVAREWSIRHGLSLSVVSNGERGARLAAGHPDGFPTTATLPEAPFAAAANFLRATLDSCLTQILANASVVGTGVQDRHVIDQLRDGLERGRTLIAEFAPMVPDLHDAWEPVLKRIFQELATHHGSAVLRAPLIQEMRAAGLGYALGTSHPREARSPGAIVQDPEFQLTLLAMLAYRHAPAPPFRPDDGTLKQMQRRFAAELVTRQARVAHDADSLRSASNRRRACRHLDRLYRLAMFASPLYEARPADSFLVRCRVAQDAFAADGEHRSGLEALEDDGEGGADVKLARRWLAARLADDRKACESLLRRVGKAAAFWAA